MSFERERRLKKRKTFKSSFRYAFEPDKFVWNEFKQAMPGPKGEPHGRGS